MYWGFVDKDEASLQGVQEPRGRLVGTADGVRLCVADKETKRSFKLVRDLNDVIHLMYLRIKLAYIKHLDTMLEYH